MPGLRQRRIYHWKHGWIPLDHIAAVSKAHGSESGAARIMARQRAATPAARRRGGTELQGHDTLPGLEQSQRELPFNPGSRPAVHRPTTPSSSKPTASPEHFRMGGKELADRAAKGDTAAQAELDRRAARKAAGGGKAGGHHPGVPFRPTPTEHKPTEPTAPPPPMSHADRQAGAKAAGEKSMRDKYGFDDRWSLSGNHMATSAGKLKPGDVIYTHTDGEVVRLPVKRGGSLAPYLVPRTVAKVSKIGGDGRVIQFTDGTSTTTINQAARGLGAPESSRTKVFGYYTDQRGGGAPAEHKPTAPPAAKPRAGSQPGNAGKFDLTPEQKAANAAKMHGTGSDKHLAALAAQDREIEKSLPAGTTISSKLLGVPTVLGKLGETPKIVHTQYWHNVDNGSLDRVGMVVSRPDGKFDAKAPGGRSLGLFDTRLAAHKALADAHAETIAEQKRQAAREEAARAAQAEKSRKVGGQTGWTPYVVKSDGSRLGDRVAAQVKQAFKSGDHTVLIETPMSQAATKALLEDISSVMDKSGAGDLVPGGVTFRVPKGDRHFRSRNGAMTGGYVISGMPVVHIHPQVANGSQADRFHPEPGTRTAAHFMPAAQTTSGRQYVLTHELGHVVDGALQHTVRPAQRTPSGFELPGAPRDDVTELVQQHRADLSLYGGGGTGHRLGGVNLQEAYAEAWAQWVQGGPGSNKAADAFARRFGWPTPKT